MAFNGRVAGISGILGGLLSRWSPDQWWRLTFLLGLVLGGGAAYHWAPEAFIDITENGTMQVLAAGLLVGLGTRIGSGCTSGHGICGIGRLSIDHWLRFFAFVGSGMLTIFFSRTSMIRYSFFSFSGLMFALGLSVSGMTEPGKVIGFLNITRSWDPSLVFVMGGAVITYFILFRLIHKRSTPLFALQFSIPERKDIDLPFLEEQCCWDWMGTWRFLPGPAVP